MPEAIDMKSVLDFLADLREHNSRPWFEAHRPAYELAARSYEALVERLLSGLSNLEDLSGVAPKDCIMRIHRDVRFSKDKTPYRSNFGASIAAGGRKSGTYGYCIIVEPGGESMVAAGLYDPEPAKLEAFRRSIVADPKPFKAILAAPAFKRHFGGLGGTTLKTCPKGYDRDHPEIEILRRTQVIAMHTMPDEVVLSPKFVSRVMTAMKALKPFVDYMNERAR